MFTELRNMLARWLMVNMNPTSVNDLMDDLDALRQQALNVLHVAEAEADYIEDQIAHLRGKVDVANLESDRAATLINSINQIDYEV